jgi:hypothetical protein
MEQAERLMFPSVSREHGVAQLPERHTFSNGRFQLPSGGVQTSDHQRLRTFLEAVLVRLAPHNESGYVSTSRFYMPRSFSTWK